MEYKLLICDDEWTIREGIYHSIAWDKMNIGVVGTARDGEEGWLWVKNHCPQFVITDIRMPKMDGIQLLKRIMTEFSRTKVILLSGYSDFTYAQLGLRYRAFDYLLKPTNPGSIMDMIDSAKQSYLSDFNQGTKPINMCTNVEDTDEALPSHFNRITRYIEEHFNEEITLDSAAGDLYLSAGHFNRILKKETKLTFLSYLTKVRVEHSKKLLATQKYSVYEVSNMTGYKDTKYFSQLFRKCVGMTPSEYMQSNKC
jgi:two-component system response regulator YesN